MGEFNIEDSGRVCLCQDYESKFFLGINFNIFEHYELLGFQQ